VEGNPSLDVECGVKRYPVEVMTYGINGFNLIGDYRDRILQSYSMEIRLAYEF
jgi:hypothetical protein